MDCRNWKPQIEPGALAGRAFDGHGSAGQPGAFLHSEDTDALAGAQRRKSRLYVKARPVILDNCDHLFHTPPDDDADATGGFTFAFPGMAQNVREGLLRNPVDGSFDLWRQAILQPE